VKRNRQTKRKKGTDSRNDSLSKWFQAWMQLSKVAQNTRGRRQNKVRLKESNNRLRVPYSLALFLARDDIEER
jgi:hypothetical protein